jgi:hypothetical protein
MKIIFFAALLTTPVAASDLTVFGFTLGEPLTLPVCTSEYYHVKTCVARSKYSDDRIIKFSEKDCPEIAHCDIYPLELDHKLMGVEFATRGVENQAAVLDALQKKYGQPTAINNRVILTDWGVRMVAVYATWDLPDIKISFNSANLDREKDGFVRIDLPLAYEWREKRKKDAAEHPAPPKGKQL